MPKLEITGTIARIYDAKTYGNFTSREFLLEVEDGKYKQTLKLEMHKERGDVLDNLREGDAVTARVDVRGRLLDDGRCFNSLVAWSVVKVDADGNSVSRDKVSRPPERVRPEVEHEQRRAARDRLNKPGTGVDDSDPDSDIPF